MRISDHCRAAAAYIRKHGWIQGTYYDNGHVCMMGALNYVDMESFSSCSQRSRPTREALEAEVGTYTLANWNDSPGRTVDEVLDLLERVAQAHDGEP